MIGYLLQDDSFRSLKSKPIISGCIEHSVRSSDMSIY